MLFLWIFGWLVLMYWDCLCIDFWIEIGYLWWVGISIGCINLGLSGKFVVVIIMWNGVVIDFYCIWFGGGKIYFWLGISDVFGVCGRVWYLWWGLL